MRDAPIELSCTGERTPWGGRRHRCPARPDNVGTALCHPLPLLNAPQHDLPPANGIRPECRERGNGFFASLKMTGGETPVGDGFPVLLRTPTVAAHIVRHGKQCETRTPLIRPSVRTNVIKLTSL